MKIVSNTILLRFPVAFILIMHSLPGIFKGTIPSFGEYLDQSGYAPMGIFLAWVIKLSHVVAAVCLVTDRYVRWAAIVTIAVLVMGIVMVHAANGWYVAGGGTNGVEFNFILIFVLAYLGFVKSNWK